MSISPLSNHLPPLALEEFARAAEQGDHIYVEVAGDRYQVLATGQTPGGRSVAWVAPDSDTATSFMQSLSHTYGTALSRTIERELGLMPNPGKPLSSRTVEQALDMANTARSALSGVDFVTALAFSAQSGSAAFRAACSEANIATDALTPQQKSVIDQDMSSRFERASAAGESPVSPAAAHTWLVEILGDLSRP